MSDFKYKQDMPPTGGYDSVKWARQIRRPGWSGYSIFAAFFGISTLAWIRYFRIDNGQKREFLELNDARVATSPIYLAERQRMYMRHLRRNRDEENELMKDVPGWETGKWNGQPVYHDINERFPPISHEEYYIHCKPKEAEDRIIYEFHRH